MNTARIVVLIFALSAGGVAAYLASGSDNKSLPVAPVAQLQTADVLVAKADIGLGHTVTPEDMQWQTWPALTASDTFIRRSDRPDAITQTGTLSLALRSIGDINMVENRTDDEVPSRGETLNVVRYGIPSATTTQK